MIVFIMLMEKGNKTTRQWAEVGTILCLVGCSGQHTTELTTRT
jgi:hypothetical protein